MGPLLGPLSSPVTCSLPGLQYRPEFPSVEWALNLLLERGLVTPNMCASIAPMVTSCQTCGCFRLQCLQLVRPLLKLLCLATSQHPHGLWKTSREEDFQASCSLISLCPCMKVHGVISDRFSATGSYHQLLIGKNENRQGPVLFWQDLFFFFWHWNKNKRHQRCLQWYTFPDFSSVHSRT